MTVDEIFSRLVRGREGYPMESNDLIEQDVEQAKRDLYEVLKESLLQQKVYAPNNYFTGYNSGVLDSIHAIAKALGVEE